MRFILSGLMLASLLASCQTTKSEKETFTQYSFEIQRMKFEYANLCMEAKKKGETPFACSDEAKELLSGKNILTDDKVLRAEYTLINYSSLIGKLKGENK
jgi:hypothetical protein